MKITDDCSILSMTPLNVIFPWFVHYGIGSENKRNNNNSDEFARVIKDVCTKSEDKDSVYNRVLSTGLFTRETIYKDINSILFGGHETTSKSLCSCLLFLKRNPSVEQKLKHELHSVLLEDGKYSVRDLDRILHNDKLDELEYLTCFVKEVLRHSPPAVRSLGYQAKKPFKLGDILVPKNQIVSLNVYAAHYDLTQWIEPTRFVPERFDPSSEYFLTPDGKTRHPLSFCPFTFGARTCPGRALGMMELKILVIYFMLAIDYEIDESTLTNEELCFAILSPFTLDIKVTKVHV
uniref:Cytochrome P450 n=2 Tax=Euplotes harpa TaxID=151035 RepID=A0A7S3NDG3_9SPIT|mmetsp:Transcript_34185/g.39458  ORF Transcript_34185/g.39458 Transcript_34185/m.39458 type:complete len:292 (+) Transcript_34185:73-948(+)